jgi:hypothetical protein
VRLTCSCGLAFPKLQKNPPLCQPMEFEVRLASAAPASLAPERQHARCCSGVHRNCSAIPVHGESANPSTDTVQEQQTRSVPKMLHRSLPSSELGALPVPPQRGCAAARGGQWLRGSAPTTAPWATLSAPAVHS